MCWVWLFSTDCAGERESHKGPRNALIVVEGNPHFPRQKHIQLFEVQIGFLLCMGAPSTLQPTDWPLFAAPHSYLLGSLARTHYHTLPFHMCSFSSCTPVSSTCACFLKPDTSGSFLSSPFHTPHSSPPASPLGYPTNKR